MTQRLDWKRDGATWPGHEHSRFVEAAGHTFHVQVSGDGPVALLLHGTGASTHSWRRFAPLLAGRFTVVAPDLPGHAFTRAPFASSLSLDAMAESIAALMVKLGRMPDLIIGHSAGAAIALQMALKGLAAPRGIVSLNGALRPLEGFASRFFPPIARMLALLPVVPQVFAWRARDPAVLDDLLKQTGSRIPPEDRAIYARLAASPPHVGAALGMMANWDLSALERSFPKVTTPVLLVAGTQDGMVPARQADVVAHRLPHAEVARLRSLGHLAHEEAPERVAATVLDWFDRVTALPAEAVAPIGATP
ncbi:alpha/beta fold hydrolase BchO [Phreatobacter oligotrophus]|uniref:Magnesium chelatase accessory protein n=1 Tax=Phreatobacter oligotrophus TaxID=1122261 RepID=A0A2T4Z2J7_9HYPH|nr:alpha/beta fold hydrolase BchO [Phreatobacter oligotrophus]PTM54985.1 magnesium chelatase accessory protein [Phreatobacter oligotrophus]